MSFTILSIKQTVYWHSFIGEFRYFVDHPCILTHDFMRLGRESYKLVLVKVETIKCFNNA